MEAGTFEGLLAGNVGDLRLGDHAHGADEKAAGMGTAIPCGDSPDTGVFLVFGAGYLGVELDVRPHIELIGDEAQVVLGFLPARVALRPGPFLQHFFGKGQAVVVALAVGGSAGVLVPRPGAANIIGAVEDFQ